MSVLQEVFQLIQSCGNLGKKNPALGGIQEEEIIMPRIWHWV